MSPKRASPLHRWDVTPKEAVAIQRDLAGRVRATPLPITRREPRFIAGVDASYGRFDHTGYAAIVVWDCHERAVVETRTAIGEVAFPYVPGLLSFREAPLVLEAAAKLERTPNVWMFDGQGLAHPRRFGLACHLGVWLGASTIGVAKSRLCGEAREPGQSRGSRTALRDGTERLGTVMRAKDRVKPLFISVGHRVSLADAERLVLACDGGYRLPEPTRLADHETTRLRRAHTAARDGEDTVAASKPPSLSLGSVAHVALRVADLARAVAFYCDVLGATQSGRGPGMVHLKLGGTDLTLIASRGGTDEKPATGLDHLGFIVAAPEDVDRAAEALRAHGARIRKGPKDRKDARFLFFTDPDNHKLEIYCPS